MSRAAAAVVAIGLAAAIALLTLDLTTIARDPGAWTDMRILFPIIHDWWTGHDTLYRAFLEQHGVPGMPYYRYPPVWAFSMLPLVLPFALRTGIALWGALSMIVLLGGVTLLLRYLGVRWFSLIGAIVLLLISIFGPLYETFYGPTKDLIIVGLLAVTFVLSERGRPRLGGLAFAIAVVLKIYPVLFAPFFLVRGRFRLLGWSAAWFAALNLAPVPFIGLRDTIDFYVTILPMVGGSSASPENAGFEILLMAAHWLRWFRSGVGALDLETFSTTAAWIWRLGVLGAFTALGVALERRSRLRAPLACYLLFCTWTAAVLVVMPVSWVNYQLFLLFPVIGFVLWLERPPLGGARAVAGVLFLAAFLPMATPVKSTLLSAFVGPLRRSQRLATTAGIELGPEFHERVAERRRRLAAAAIPADAARLGPGERRALLRARGVPDGSSRGPQRDALRARLQALQSDPAVPPGGAIVRETRARLRAASLTTTRLVGLLVLRAVAGLLAFVSVGLACVVLLLREPAEARPAQG